MIACAVDAQIIKDFSEIRHALNAGAGASLPAFAHVAANEGFLELHEFVMTDFYFAAGELETGFTFADSLRPVFTKPILLCSDGDFTPEMIQGQVDAVISKNPVEWEKLSQKVAELMGRS